jgi:hypothetical protein
MIIYLICYCTGWGCSPTLTPWHSVPPPTEPRVATPSEWPVMTDWESGTVNEEEDPTDWIVKSVSILTDHVSFSPNTLTIQLFLKSRVAFRLSFHLTFGCQVPAKTLVTMWIFLYWSLLCQFSNRRKNWFAQNNVLSPEFRIDSYTCVKNQDKVGFCTFYESKYQQHGTSSVGDRIFSP